MIDSYWSSLRIKIKYFRKYHLITQETASSSSDTYHELKKCVLDSVLIKNVGHAAGRRTGLEVMKAVELALLLASCSTWDSGPCTLPGQHSSVGPGEKGAD